MTVDNPEVTPTSKPQDDAMIDLRVYLDVLIHWWREILFFTLLGSIGAGVLVFVSERMKEPAYQASSTAVMARVTSSITLDERSQSLSNVSAKIDTARRSALVGLVNSGAIAASVVDELGDSPGITGIRPATLLTQVQAEAVPSADSRTPSDLIRITATADSPELAAAIANSWMRNYVDEVNALYGQIPVEVYDAVVGEQAQSEANFANAQNNLEDFIAKSHISTLTREIAEQQALVDFLKQGQIDADVAAIARDIDLRIALFESLSAAQTEPVLAMLDEQTRQNVQEIASLFATQNRAERQLLQAQALHTQISSGGNTAAASNTVALQLLKSQIFADQHATTPIARNSLTAEQADEATSPTITTPSTPMQWLIDSNITPATAEEQLQDVTALIASIESYITHINEQITAVGVEAGTGDAYQFLDQLTKGRLATNLEATDAVDDSSATDALQAAIISSYIELSTIGDSARQQEKITVGAGDTEITKSVENIEQHIQKLMAQLEAERSLERQLTQQRDLAWNAYETLSNKVVELDLERTAANREVRSGTLATAPLTSIEGNSPLMAAAVGGTIGLLFGIFIAFLMNYMGKQPLLHRRTTTA